MTLSCRNLEEQWQVLYYWQSPTVVIDQYTADSHDKLSLEWLVTVQTEHRFWQSHTLMLEMMLYFTRNIPQNSRVSKQVNSWCSTMSVSNISWARSVYTYGTFEDDPNRCVTWNWLLASHLDLQHASHKPQASDLSSEESEQLRTTLNEGSPLRRRK